MAKEGLLDSNRCTYNTNNLFSVYDLGFISPMDKLEQIENHLNEMEGEVRSWHASRGSRAQLVKRHIEAIRTLIQPESLTPVKFIDSVRGFFTRTQ